MKEGDVIIVPMPQADGMVKNRPAIILPRDAAVSRCACVWREHATAQAARDFDEVISPSDADFDASGLQAESLIRLGFLVVLPPARIAGSIGSISSERRKRLLQRLSEYLIQ